MNIGQLEAFLAIVDSGSLTEAAFRVGLTQSAVSYSLGKLEAELGVTLLERGRSGASLTRVGHEIVKHGRAALAELEIIRQIAARERGLATGRLRVGTVSSIPARMLTGILRDFQQKYPDIDIVIFDGNPAEPIEWLKSGVVDVGMVMSAEGYADAVPLARSQMHLVATADHRLAAAETIKRDALLTEVLIGPRREYGVFDTTSGFNLIPLPRVRHEVSSLHTILAMVREGMGVTLMPAMLIDPAYEGVITRPFEPSVYLEVYLAARIVSPASQAFMASAHAWAKAHGYIEV